MIAATATASIAIGPAAAAAADDQPVVIATMSIWADIVDQVDCTDTFDVQSLIPAGGDPHSYEPSMQDRDRLGEAALMVVNGADLEAGLIDTIDAAADDGTPLFAVADHVTTHAMSEDDEHEHEAEADDSHADESEATDEHADEDSHADHSEAADEDHDHEEGDEHDHDHGGVDPHVWLDPTLVAEAVPAIGEALVAAGADETAIADCVATVTTSLTELDDEITALVEAIPPAERLLVTNHDALGYFARRYGFVVLGSVLPSTSTLVEASPAELDELAAKIEEANDGNGVPAIFAEALEATDDATTLGDRLGVEVVTLYTDSLGEDGSGADTYQAMLLHDATLIVDALTGG